MSKSSLKTLPRVRRFLLDRRLETGFSMLEAVIVVGVLLALAIAGFFAYGAITQNAKKAAIKDAASKVHTAVLVADTDGDSTTTPADVIDGWNVSTDQTFVELLKDSKGQIKRDNGDFCVEATNLPNRDVKQRAGSCDDVVPGSGGNNGGNNGGGDNGGNNGETINPVIDTSSIMRTTWDTSIDGCEVLKIPALGNANATIDWGDGNTSTLTRTTNDETDGSNSPTHSYATQGLKNVTIDGTFEGWSYYDDVNNCIIKVDSWGDGTATVNAEGAFYQAKNLTSVVRLPLTVTNIESLFDSSNFNGDVSNWDVSNVTNMAYAFYGTPFSGDVSKWNVSNVTRARTMFAGAKNFNSNISKWNVSKMENMASMFSGATSFNQDLSGWDTISSVNMSFMFADTPSFNSDLSRWKVQNVVYMGNMFDRAISFDADITRWDTSSAQQMQSMFSGTKAFNRDVSGWNVENVVTLGESNYWAFNESSNLVNEHIPAAFRPITEVTFTPLASSNTSSVIVNAMNARLAYLSHPDLLAALLVRNYDPAPYDAWEGRANSSQVRLDFENVWDLMADNTGEHATFTQLLNQQSNNIPALRTAAESTAVLNFYYYNWPSIKNQQKYVDAVRAYYQAALDAPRLAAIPTVGNASHGTIPASAGTASQVAWANAQIGYVSSKYNLYQTWTQNNGYQYSDGYDGFYIDTGNKLSMSPEGVTYQNDVINAGMYWWDQEMFAIYPDPSIEADWTKAKDRLIAAKRAYLYDNTVRPMSFAETQQKQREYIDAMQEFYPIAFANVKLVYG